MAVIDCHDREVVGYELSLRGRAQEAERVLEEACRFHRLEKEFITPYAPEQNGLVERFFGTLKEECISQHRFTSFAQARRVVTAWIDWYNTRHPHSALGYLSPAEYRAQQQRSVA